MKFEEVELKIKMNFPGIETIVLDNSLEIHRGDRNEETGTLIMDIEDLIEDFNFQLEPVDCSSGCSWTKLLCIIS